MTACGRHLAGKTAVALLAAAAGLAASLVASEAADSPISLAVQIGYHNSVKLGQWIPVEVDATNRGAEFDGNLEIASSGASIGKRGPPGGAAVYETPVTLAPGSTKHFRTYVSEDQPGTIDVRLVQGGRVVASQQA